MDEKQTHSSSESSMLRPGTHRNGDQEVARDSDKPRELSHVHPSPLKAALKGLKPHLDVPTLIFMLKGSLPVAICLCLIQTDLYSRRYGAEGHIAAIIALLGCAFLPRAKFNQNIILCAFVVCIGACITLLAMYCGIKARNSSMVDPSKRGYNSSQAAVCATWLFADIWASSTLRAKSSVFTNPVFLQNVFVMVSLSYAPRFSTMQQSITSCVNLLELFMLGLGTATAVHYFVFPLSTRTVLFKQQTGFLNTVRKVIKLQAECLIIERIENDSADATGEFRIKNQEKAAMASATLNLAKQYEQMQQNVPFAMRETAWGKLSAIDLQELEHRFRQMLTSVTSMSLFIDKLLEPGETKTSAPSKGSTRAGDETVTSATDAQLKALAIVGRPVGTLMRNMDPALQHGLVVLQLQRGLQVGFADSEAKSGGMQPGDQAFLSHFSDKIINFSKHRDYKIQAMKQEDGTSFRSVLNSSEATLYTSPDSELLLLGLSTSKIAVDMAYAIHELDRFADSKIADGTLRKSRLIIPSSDVLLQWLSSIWDKSQGTLLAPPRQHGHHPGSLYGQSRNPEHLPAENTWEELSDYLRKFSHAMSSTESIFGFRVALATLSGTIMAFLRQTYDFYFDQRIIWSVIVIVVGWHMTAGQSFFALVGRIIATLVGMCFSWLAYYIPDGHPGGVLPLTWLFFFILMYFFRTRQQLIGALIVCGICITSIIGTALLTDKIGADILRKSGQAIYAPWLLAPYRALIVTIGCGIAFFWTIFPYPITERQIMRQEMAAALQDLTLYHDCCQATLVFKLCDQQSSAATTTTSLPYPESESDSEQTRLQTLRRQAFDSLHHLIASLHTRLQFHKYELPIGGRFPCERYATILNRIETLFDVTTQLAQTFPSSSTPHTEQNQSSLASAAAAASASTPPAKPKDWNTILPSIINKLTTSSQQLSLHLAILSSAIKTATPLPPFLAAPEPASFPEVVNFIGRDVSSSAKSTSDGLDWGGSGANGEGNKGFQLDGLYERLAMVRMLSGFICEEVKGMMEDVKGLVGEIDFVGPIGFGGGVDGGDGRGDARGEGDRKDGKDEGDERDGIGGVDDAGKVDVIGELRA